MLFFVLATQGCQMSLDEGDCESEADGEAGKADPLEPVLRWGERFKFPLLSAGVDAVL